MRVKYHSKEIEKLRYIGGGKSDWVDLRVAENVSLTKGEYRLISMGISVEIPEGYEMLVAPRSSTFKNFGLLQTNSVGVVDESYCGDEDILYMPVYATRDTELHINDRICQFRLIRHQPELEFEETIHLGHANRGGFGSTGIMLCLLFLLASIVFSSCSSKVSEYRLEGIDYLEKGKYEEAIERFEEALAESKGRISNVQYDILCYRAEAEYMLGEYDTSKETLDTLVELDGEKERYQRMLRQIEAKFLLRDAAEALDKGELETARAKMDEAAAAGLLNDQDLEYNEAVYLEKTAQWEEAYAAFTEYLSQYPGDADAERELVFLESRVKALKDNYALRGVSAPNAGTGAAGDGEAAAEAAGTDEAGDAAGGEGTGN